MFVRRLFFFHLLLPVVIDNLSAAQPPVMYTVNRPHPPNLFVILMYCPSAYVTEVEEACFTKLNNFSNTH